MIKSYRDSKYVFLVCSKGNMIKLDIKMRRVTKKFGTVHQGRGQAACCSKDWLLTSDQKGTIYQWCLHTEVVMKKYEGASSGSVCALIMDTKQDVFWSGDSRGNINVWSLKAQD